MNGEMRFVETAETGADPLGDLLRCQQAGGLDNPPLAMHPFRLDRIEPRTLRGQRTDHDPHPRPCPLDRPVVCPDPSSHRRADMPTRVIPHEQQRRFPLCRQSVAAPLEELRRQRTHRATVHEAQPQLLIALPDGIPLADQQAVAANAFASGSSRVTTCSISRNGAPSSAQLARCGRAIRLHQTSSAKPSAQSGCVIARRIRRFRPLFCGDMPHRER